MSDRFSRRQTLESLVVLALGAGYGTGTVGAEAGGDGHHDEDGPTLNRFATTVTGAEFTGIFVTRAGDLFFNVQHPKPENADAVDEGTIGTVAGANMHALPDDFPSVQPPEGDADHVRTALGEYRPLAHGGDETAGGERLGVPYTADGEPMTAGDNPDFNGFVPGDEPGVGYLFTNWETQPGMVSRLTLRGGGVGNWRVERKENLDFRPVEGTWNNCFGTVSPWGTPLTSEEYEPNAAAWFHSEETTYGAGDERVADYLGRFGNAYRYGYIVEIDDPTGESPAPVKHFAMGRFSHENAVVMPDRQTVYMSDDGTGTVFFKFEADEPGDLSAGTLYAARADQERGTDPAEVGFELEWIELAHATDEEVESWIAEYDDQEPSTDPNYVTDAEIEAWANGNAADDRAAFLESRKAAAAVGATDEFRKMEGVNVQPGAEPGDFLYMAMSAQTQTMLANEETTQYDDPQDDIHVEGNEYGAVYRMRLDENYDVHRMEPAVVGGPDANVCGGCPYDARPDSKSAVCEDCSFNPGKEDDGKGLVGKGMATLTDSSSSVDPENAIANPDNLVPLRDGRVVIGEDSWLHRPNMLWVYDPGPGRR